jgi:outer membrane receptor protein involved in Fe transport
MIIPRFNLPPRLLLTPALPALFVLASLPSAAQQVRPDATAGADARDEVVMMSVFNVNTEKDDGYIASETLVGGRINTEVLMTPSDITILTREFLNDVAAETYMDTAQWLTSAEVTPRDIGVPVDNGDRVSFRGMAATYPTRNYFRYQTNIDGFVVERLENARGPNSLLYGDAVAGGIINFSTKQAYINRKIKNVQLRLDSEGSLRATADFNITLGRKAAVRVNLLANEGKNWISTYLNNRYGAQIAAKYRLSRNTEIMVEAEGGNWRQNYTPASAGDYMSSWDRKTVITSTTSSYGKGITRYGTDHLTFMPNYDELGVINGKGWGVTQGTGLRIVDNLESRVTEYLSENYQFPSLKRGFSIQPSNFLTRNKYNVESATIQQQVGRNLVLELAWQHSQHKLDFDQGSWDNYRIDINQNMTIGGDNGTIVPNPRFLEPYSEIYYTKQLNDQYNTDYRASAAYILPFKTFHQRLIFSASQRDTQYNYKNYQFARSNGTNPSMYATENRVFVRYYWNDGPQDFKAPTNSNGYEFGWVKTNDSLTKGRLRTYSLATVGYYWDSRISLVGGIRRDAYHESVKRPTVRDTQGNLNENVEVTEQELKETSPTIGAVFFPVRWVGVYGNYSESYAPGVMNPWPSLSGRGIAPIQGKGVSYGLRFKLLGGRLVGSAGYYKNLQENNRISLRADTTIDRIWEQLEMSENSFGSQSYTDTRTFEATGYEFEVVGRVTKTLQISANLAFPDNKQGDSVPDTRAYYNANIGLWESVYAAPGAPGNKNTIRQAIDDFKQYIDNAEDGRKQNGTPDWRLNVIISYGIPSGPLRALRLGVGANVFGKSVIGNEVDRPFDYIYRKGYPIMMAFATYRLKIYNYPVELQLNIQNLLDYDKPIYTSTTIYDDTTYSGAGNNRHAYYGNFNYPEPRKYILSATIRF